MNIRKSTTEDVPRIMTIFAAAKEYMASHGNGTQWGDGYPNEETLMADIAAGNSYVIESDGTVVGTFSFIVGEEPTYRLIKNGEWTADRAYGTIHRLAADGTAKGIAKACFEYCAKRTDYIRVDTHENNASMRAAIEKIGFRKCGNIYVRGGAERTAYDYLSGGENASN